MTPEEVSAALDLIDRVDQRASERTFEDLESFLDASDRTVAQLAQLKLMNQTDDSEGVAELIAAVGMEGADPT